MQIIFTYRPDFDQIFQPDYAILFLWTVLVLIRVVCTHAYLALIETVYLLRTLHWLKQCTSCVPCTNCACVYPYVPCTDKANAYPRVPCTDWESVPLGYLALIVPVCTPAYGPHNDSAINHLPWNFPATWRQLRTIKAKQTIYSLWCNESEELIKRGLCLHRVLSSEVVLSTFYRTWF